MISVSLKIKVGNKNKDVFLFYGIAKIIQLNNPTLTSTSGFSNKHGLNAARLLFQADARARARPETD